MTVLRANLRETAPATGVPDPNAITEATKILSDAVKNEETRFSNLNTRAVGVLSATSLVTALIGVFSKDLIAQTFVGRVRYFGGAGAVVSIVLLVATAGIVVWGVLYPGPRLLFGGNDLVGNPSSVTSAAQVDSIAFVDYLAIYQSLALRNTSKARYLSWAYWCFFGAVTVIGFTAALLVLARV